MAGLDVDYYASGQYSCQPSTSAATPGMMTQNDADSVTSVMPGGDDLAESSSLQPEASKSKKQKNDKKPRYVLHFQHVSNYPVSTKHLYNTFTTSAQRLRR